MSISRWNQTDEFTASQSRLAIFYGDYLPSYCGYCSMPLTRLQQEAGYYCCTDCWAEFMTYNPEGCHYNCAYHQCSVYLESEEHSCPSERKSENDEDELGW
jgi:hypothetical protein